MVSESLCRKLAWGCRFDRHTSLSQRFVAPFTYLRTALDAIDFPTLLTYHPGHPNGRHYETSQVNANEAEWRRIARFREVRHTPGRFEVPREDTTLEYPYTLDLSRSAPC